MSVVVGVLRLLAAVGALVVVPAGPAAAHVAGDSTPSNYSGVITSVSAPMPGVQVQLSVSDDEIQLTNDSDVDVVVPGYSEEPYLRIGLGGVQRNDRSPATYLNATVQGDTPLPPRADASASPEWESCRRHRCFAGTTTARTGWAPTCLRPSRPIPPGPT